MIEVINLLKKYLPLLCFLVFLLAILTIVIFREYTLIIWVCGIIAAIAIFCFSYFLAIQKNTNNKEEYQKKIINHLQANVHRSGIDELIYELYTKRSNAEFLSSYKKYIDSINFSLADLEAFEFDIQFSKLHYTTYIRYDEGYLRIDSSDENPMVYVYVKEMDFQNIKELIQSQLKGLNK